MILCCGEALIDMIPAPTNAGPDGFVPHSGGAVFNTAIALGRLGVEAGLLSGVSRDLFGAQIVADLEASGVSPAALIRSDRSTTLAFVKLVEGQASYSFFDENSAGRMLAPADMPAIPPAVSALFFGGISLACEPAADAYAALLARESAGHLIMLDPNIRPGFISDIPRYRARLDGMMAGADIVKVSDEDLTWLFPDPPRLEDKVAALLSAGPELLIVTKGGAGATGYLKQGGEVTVPAAHAKVVDTVGAGDTFNAGVLAQLHALGHLNKGAIAALPLPVLEAVLTHGARVAAITVSRSGANPPWATEL